MSMHYNYKIGWFLKCSERTNYEVSEEFDNNFLDAQSEMCDNVTFYLRDDDTGYSFGGYGYYDESIFDLSPETIETMKQEFLEKNSKYIEEAKLAYKNTELFFGIVTSYS